MTAGTLRAGFLTGLRNKDFNSRVVGIFYIICKEIYEKKENRQKGKSSEKSKNFQKVTKNQESQTVKEEVGQSQDCPFQKAEGNADKSQQALCQSQRTRFRDA